MSGLVLPAPDPTIDPMHNIGHPFFICIWPTKLYSGVDLTDVPRKCFLRSDRLGAGEQLRRLACKTNVWKGEWIPDEGTFQSTSRRVRSSDRCRHQFR